MDAIYCLFYDDLLLLAVHEGRLFIFFLFSAQFLPSMYFSICG